MIRGYFGWLGSFTVGSADLLARSISNEPTRPTVDYYKMATGNMASDLKSTHSRYISQMYDQAKVLEEAHATYNFLRKNGRIDEAKEFRADHADELKRYGRVNSVKDMMSKQNERIRHIEKSNISPDDKRDKINEVRNNESDRAKRLFVN